MLKDLSWVCEETCPELRSLPIPCDGISQTQVCISATCLHSDRSMGRRHVWYDATEEGLAPARVAFRDYWRLPFCCRYTLWWSAHTASSYKNASDWMSLCKNSGHPNYIINNYHLFLYRKWGVYKLSCSHYDIQYVDGVSFQTTRGSYTVVFWAKLKRSMRLLKLLS